jgi:hypothetical protein
MTVILLIAALLAGASCFAMWEYIASVERDDPGFHDWQHNWRSRP